MHARGAVVGICMHWAHLLLHLREERAHLWEEGEGAVVSTRTQGVHLSEERANLWEEGEGAVVSTRTQGVHLGEERARTAWLIRGHQRSSEVIRGHQRSSEVI